MRRRDPVPLARGHVAYAPKKGAPVRTPTVHGELSADEQTLVVMAHGPPALLGELAVGLRAITPQVTRSNPPGALLVPASWPAALQLADAYGGHWAPGPRLRAWLHTQVIARTTPPPGALHYQLPDGYVPRPYQIAGAGMLAATGSGLLFDEPGTGKTATTILALAEREAAHSQNVRPVVCVVPGSVVDAWVREWQAWCPQWQAVAWRGTRRKRRALAGTADVYVVSYDTCRMDATDHRAALQRLAPRTVVADEVHMLKSPHAKRSRAVRRLAKAANGFIGLSGTPITHTAADLWPTLQALDPVAWPSRERWVGRYCTSVRGDYADVVTGLDAATEPELRTALLGQHRRVTKADVLTQLPPKVYATRSVQLPPKARTAYDTMRDEMLADLGDGQHLSAMTVLAQLTRLSQLACATADVAVTHDVADDGSATETVRVTLRAPSWKVDALIDVLDERPGSPVVAFAPSRQLMMLAGQAATAHGARVGYVVGGQKGTARDDAVRALQAGKLDLLCASTQAGGVGLTLTAARTAVFLQRPWSLVDSLQAEDRIHRIGSEAHDSIEIIDVVADDTIDDKVRRVLHDKAVHLSAVLEDPRIITQLLGGNR